MAKATKADRLIAAIRGGFAAGGKDEWDAPEFGQARELTAGWGCAWDFAGWRELVNRLESEGAMGRPQVLGGIDLN